MAWYLVRPDGSELDLQSSTVKAVLGIAGLVFPPVEYYTQRSPFGGDIVVDRRLQGRSVDLPLIVFAKPGGTWRGTLAEVISYVSTDPNSPSYLVWRGVHNRRLAVVLRGGAHWSTQDTGLNWAKVVVPLYAPDPAWEDETPTTVAVGSVGVVPFLPDWPFLLTAGDILGEAMVNINGHGAYPVWTIRGAATGIIVENVDTGEMFELPGLVLNDNDVAVIDTTPLALRNRTAVMVYRVDGSVENAFSAMTTQSKLWHLTSGSNTVRVHVLSSGTDASVVLDYRERYYGPWESDE